MNIGILGTGKIAHAMASTIVKMSNVTLKAVASRTLEKAKAFAAEYDMSVFYGSYEELASDETIDLVYIATPHSRHYEDCMMMLGGGRNVLCEKAFTANGQQAREVLAYAEEKDLFITEAIWTRFMPMRMILDGILASGVIGNVSSLTANLGYELSQKERLQKPELAGGALLDLGVYTINFALMAFGNEVTEIKSFCTKNSYGVDSHNSILMQFKDGKTAVLHSNAMAKTDRMGVIYGDKGRIEVTNINNCEGIMVILNDGMIKTYQTPEQISGYEYEVSAALAAIEQCETECMEMPHSETIRVMDIMDGLRKEWGIVYPFEEKNV